MLRRLPSLSVIVILILVVLAFFSFGISVITVKDDIKPEWWSNLFQNLATEMVGALLTFLLLERFLHWFEEKGRLVRELGSAVNDIAKRAAEELRNNKWLENGKLRRIYIAGSNLENAQLSFVDLRGAVLTRANLTNADLSNSNLEDTDLSNANLCGTNLYDSNLKFASLSGALFDENTILPSGENWGKNTDLTYYTDPNQKWFWRSQSALSPASYGPVYHFKRSKILGRWIIDHKD